MPPIRVRSGLAMQIAGIDRVKFNEAVADGFYPCAPQTVKGATRLFTETDLIALYIFARLLDKGMTPKHAGPLACEFRDAVRAHENEDRIVRVMGRGGLCHMFPGSGYDPDHLKKDRIYRGLEQVISCDEFHIANIRQIIRDAIDEERSIIGEPDENGQ